MTAASPFVPGGAGDSCTSVNPSSSLLRGGTSDLQLGTLSHEGVVEDGDQGLDPKDVVAHVLAARLRSWHAVPQLHRSDLFDLALHR